MLSIPVSEQHAEVSLRACARFSERWALANDTLFEAFRHFRDGFADGSADREMAATHMSLMAPLAAGILSMPLCLRVLAHNIAATFGALPDRETLTVMLRVLRSVRERLDREAPYDEAYWQGLQALESGVETFMVRVVDRAIASASAENRPVGFSSVRHRTASDAAPTTPACAPEDLLA